MGNDTMNLIRTTHTYATPENALRALNQALGERRLDDTRYIIAVAGVTKPYRFVPVLVGQEYIPFIHLGITVVG
jgi:hypothetical protein